MNPLDVYKAPPDAAPWERQSDEPSEAFRQFVFYRDMPMPRALASGFVGGSTVMDRMKLANAWNWWGRVKAYDDHLAARMVEEREEHIKRSAKDLHEQRMLLLKPLGELGQREMAKWLDRSRREATTVMKPGELLRLLEFLFRAERLEMGETTENVGEGHIDLSHLSDEQLEERLATLRKITGQDPK